MVKLIFTTTGEELEILSCGFSSFGTIHIDCVLPFEEVLEIFGKPENYSDFEYLYEVEVGPGIFDTLKEHVMCDSVVSISMQFNNWITGNKTVTIILHGTHEPIA